MNGLLKAFGYENLLGTALELIIATQISRASNAAGRVFTVPASIVLRICKTFNVVTPEGQQMVIDAFRSVGAAVTSVIEAINANRSAK